MTTPTVSILLPTLNSMRFLWQRIASIYAQNLTDWELLVGDSASTDGTWEFLSEYAKTDSRIKLYQLPRGLYQAWNSLIEKSTGKYIYIATSDDTMRPDCLSKMVAALEENPECSLCDSMIRLIDTEGRDITEQSPLYLPHHWHVDFPRGEKHLRQCPHDYFLHFCGKTVYTSITQVLIKRDLFEKTGLFDPSFGRSSDFLWGVRAARHANVIFIPERLASWRIHEDQITNNANPADVDKSFHQMSAMARAAIAEEKDEELKAKAEYVFKLIPFKEMLLPAKRKRNLLYFFRSLVLASLFHPVLSFQYFLCALETRKKAERRTWLIKSYDLLAEKRIKKLKIAPYISPSPHKK